MKRYFLLLITLSFSITAWSQENLVTLSGGYSFAKIEDVDENATGWRINGLYEFNPMGGAISHGLSVGYISTGASSVSITEQTTEYTLSSIPVYYAPKVMFGSDKIKGFVKGALGMHFSNFKETRTLGSLSTRDNGFYAGLSLGGMLFFSDMIYVNLEYEWAYMGNFYYNNGFINSAMLGFGINF